MKESTTLSCPVCGSRMLYVSGISMETKDYRVHLDLHCHDCHKFTVHLDVSRNGSDNSKILADMLSVWADRLATKSEVRCYDD